MTAFDQRDAACRLEWGVTGHDHLASAAVTIVVDVFSFSTCVDIAVSRGAMILPYAWQDGSAKVFANLHTADLAGSRSSSRYSRRPLLFWMRLRGCAVSSHPRMERR